jgi:hypothetical protein
MLFGRAPKIIILSSALFVLSVVAPHGQDSEDQNLNAGDELTENAAEDAAIADIEDTVPEPSYCQDSTRTYVSPDLDSKTAFARVSI